MCVFQVRFNAAAGYNEAREWRGDETSGGWVWQGDGRGRLHGGGEVPSTFNETHLRPLFPQSSWSQQQVPVDIHVDLSQQYGFSLMTPKPPSWQGTIDACEVLMFLAVKSGDVRTEPRSQTEALGRLEEGMALVVQQGYVDEDGRMWVRMSLIADLKQGSTEKVSGAWTAINKKNGVQKLKYVGAYHPCDAVARKCASDDIPIDSNCTSTSVLGYFFDEFRDEDSSDEIIF